MLLCYYFNFKIFYLSIVAMELNSDSHIKEFMKLIEISASDHSDFWS